MRRVGLTQARTRRTLRQSGERAGRKNALALAPAGRKDRKASIGDRLGVTEHLLDRLRLCRSEPLCSIVRQVAQCSV